LLVLASLVEKETAVAAERERIAGVFQRRLERGMRLQTDPTVAYGLRDELDGRLRRVHLRTDHPWNTYTRHGLPPTPIALPGRASLQAAARPADGTALYFVARGDGTHAFSDTLAEHNRAVDRFIRGRR
ncbi:MAG: endolytic transglycosylase MltG, partial [Wenzhouxiangellaceae bacterium]|nr:endolytic transglycosylase MltG [Wenzhouxiangellaceae bacterium]